MLNRIKLKLHYLLPRRLLTEFLGWVSNISVNWFTKIIINIFVWYYKINLQEAKNPNILSYKTFNDFFSRAIREDKRPYDLDPNVIIQPSDGLINELGHINYNQIFQAKGHIYSLEALLAGNYKISKKFYNGEFVVSYIQPGNYHRVHMPCNAILREMIYVPGELFSVSPFYTKNIPNLFARNERIICYFDTKFGHMAQILIGATIAGSIVTVWNGKITPPRTGIIKHWTWKEKNNAIENKNIILLKGQEMGHFKLGSTVINLFSPNCIKFSKKLKPGSKVFCRQKLAILLKKENIK